MSSDLIRPTAGQVTLRVSPGEMRWRYLGFEVLSLRAGEQVDLDSLGREMAIVPISGAGTIEAGDGWFELNRDNVFDAAPVLYVPPTTRTRVTAGSEWVAAIGTAPRRATIPCG